MDWSNPEPSRVIVNLWACSNVSKYRLVCSCPLVSKQVLIFPVGLILDLTIDILLENLHTSPREALAINKCANVLLMSMAVNEPPIEA